jgi:hypothetical protein
VIVRRFAPGLLLLLACSGNKQPNATPISNDTSFGPSDGGAVADANASECADATKDVFVISEDSSLYSFHPPTNEFKLVGALHCPTSGATPTSMAIDRHGFAWIRHSDGSIWRVSTADLTCSATGFVPRTQADQFYKFGMGFSTSSDGGSNEELFLSDNAGAGLARLDTTTMKPAFVGPYTGALAHQASELTGTGDGKLYGFFVTQPAQIAEISKGTGAIVSANPLANVFAGNSWAFSFYGGDFYIYTHAASAATPPLADGGSDVTRYRPQDGSIVVVKPKIGFKIVGAGVSTCAPTTAVK